MQCDLKCEIKVAQKGIAMKDSKQNRYLQLRRNGWFLHWNVPTVLREHPLFNGRKIYTKTLQTSDLMEARRMRDQMIVEFERLKAEAKEAPRRMRFNSILDEIREAKATLDREEPYMNAHELLDAHDAIESLFDAEAAFEKGDRVKADAILAGLHGHTDIIKLYGMTLRDAAECYIKANAGTVHANTLGRVKNATGSFLTHLKKQSVLIDDIDKRDVTLWIDSLRGKLSDRTRGFYLTAMSGMWEWNYLMRNVEGTNPFKDIKRRLNKDSSTREDFTFDEVNKLADAATPPLMFLMKYGLITGCRISELTGLSLDNFDTQGTIHFIRISEGKTENAVRVIPLPYNYWSELKSCITTGIWTRRKQQDKGRAWSGAFSTFKSKTLGDSAGTSTFHSFRHMTATAYENAMIPEQVTVHIMGHSKKGLALSYGLYSSGMKLPVLMEAVETMLASDYMQQFIRLFNK